MDHILVKLTPDEARYIISNLEGRKEVVSRSEMIDLDYAIEPFQKAIDEFTVDQLYKDLERMRVFGG